MTWPNKRTLSNTYLRSAHVHDSAIAELNSQCRMMDCDLAMKTAGYSTTQPTYSCHIRFLARQVDLSIKSNSTTRRSNPEVLVVEKSRNIPPTNGRLATIADDSSLADDSLFLLMTLMIAACSTSAPEPKNKRCTKAETYPDPFSESLLARG